MCRRYMEKQSAIAAADRGMSRRFGQIAMTRRCCTLSRGEGSLVTSPAALPYFDARRVVAKVLERALDRRATSIA